MGVAGYSPLQKPGRGGTDQQSWDELSIQYKIEVPQTEQCKSIVCFNGFLNDLGVCLKMLIGSSRNPSWGFLVCPAKMASIQASRNYKEQPWHIYLFLLQNVCAAAIIVIILLLLASAHSVGTGLSISSPPLEQVLCISPLMVESLVFCTSFRINSASITQVPCHITPWLDHCLKTVKADLVFVSPIKANKKCATFSKLSVKL